MVVRQAVRRSILLAAISAAMASRNTVNADPTPCVAGTCGGTTTWLTNGQANLIKNGSTTTINQLSDRAILNWSNFDIAPDGRVIFNQPSSSAVALNRIFQSSPSQILGALESNGQIYLINQNGFLFGSGARVNVGGLLASSLNITDADFGDGLLAAIQQRRAVLSADVGVTPGAIDIAAGATIATRGPDQRLLFAAPSISNGGLITAPDGQVMLAAGQKLYLQASSDPQLRGLLVEVDGGGDVVNAATGDIRSDRGNVTLLGLAVNQNGRVSATTSTSLNGSIRLIARDTARLAIASGGVQITPTRNGTVTLGADSVTSVLPDATDTSLVVDGQPQPTSTVDLYGQRINLEGGSQIVAPSGQLNVTAALGLTAAAGEKASIHVDSGASIDLSGADASASVTRNLVSVELRSNELADSPLQRDGPLRGATVIVDARVGTPLANISGYVGLTQRSVQERLGAGGTATFTSDGDVVVADGATVNVSGGVVNYTPGLMQTTQLIRADGTMVDIGSANPNDVYLAVYNPTYRQVFDRWGVVRMVQASGIAHNDPGYVEGKSAGTIQFQSLGGMVLNGNFLGQATNGVYQRTAAQMAQGGAFIVGNPTGTTGFLAPQINLVNDAPQVVLGDDADLPAGFALNLPLDFARTGGFSRITLASDAGISMPADVDLQLLPGASLSLIAPNIHVDGAIDAPAGSIAMRTAASTISQANSGTDSGLYLGAGTQLNVDGLWTNDALSPGTTPTGLVLPNAGSISLTQSLPDGALVIGDGVGLHASGGGWLNQNAQLTGGTGGAITIAAPAQLTGNGRIELGKDLAFDGFGVQGAAGGTFALQAPRLLIHDLGNANLPSQLLSAAVDGGGVLEVGSALFRDDGFSRFRLTATGNRPTDASGGILTVSDDISVETRTRYLSADATTHASQRDVDAFATLQLPPLEQRTASDVQFSAVSAAATTFADAGNLLVDSSASITAAAGSSLSFTTTGSLDFNGQLLAHSGSAKLLVQTPPLSYDQGYMAGQHLQLGDSAVIDVGGAYIPQPNDSGLLRGNLLAGGSVQLSAQRGSVITQSGSRIDISGTTTSLDLPVSQSATGWKRTVVASAAGSLNVNAVESVSLLGHIDAYGGRGDTGEAAGGTLQLNLSRTTNGIQLVPGASTNYPSSPRVIQLTSLQPALVGDNSGLAMLNPQQLRASGFDSMKLLADDRIEVEGGLDVVMDRQLVLQTPVLSVIGSGTGTLRAPYVALGSGANLDRGPAALGGTGNLGVQADAIDLVGFLSLSGVKSATLQSTGQIDLLGGGNRSSTDVNANLGGLDIAGDLTLNAARVVPGSGVDFTINAAGGISNTVHVGQTGTLAGTPLSVGGSLTINADSIAQDGTLLAPFGRIALNASNALTLGAGSITSTSAAGALLPYGRVDEGSTESWVYGLTADSAAAIDGVPQRAVSLTGSQVVMAPGAKVDVSGGGDLYAALWTPGTGGSRDVLKAGTVPGLYAVLPALGTTHAPYDPLMYEGSDLKPGDTVYLAGGGGLAPGYYALLPARYALLPGAFLVQAASGYKDIEPGTAIAATPGATVVAGFRSFGTEGIDGGRYDGFVVTPGSYAHQLADYTDELASKFFLATDSAAGSATSLLPRALPADAGTLAIQVGDFLDARGTVVTTGANGGRNATISVTAEDLQVDPTVVSAPADGVAHIAATTLDAWNPGTLLLGGTLDADGNVQVVSDTVNVAQGGHLQADELLLVAGSAVTVQQGASLRTRSTTSTADDIEQTTVNLTGAKAPGASVLGVSDLHDLTTARPAGTATPATLSVDAGAAIESHGSILIDGPGGVQLPGAAVNGSGANWSLGANTVVFGDASSSTFGIDAALVDKLNQGSSVRIAASTSIDINRATHIGAPGSGRMQQLSLLTPVLQNHVAAASSFDADHIVLGSASTTPVNVAAGGDGALSLNASRIDIGPGALALAGFGSAELQASDAVVGTGTGTLVSSGDLTISTALLTTTSGAVTSIATPNGALVLQDATPDANGDITPGIGGMLTLAGKSIDAGIDISLPSGVLTLDAQDSLVQRSGSMFDVGGVTPDFAAQGSPGGSIRLHSGGDVNLAAGSSLRVTGAPGADAGDIDVSASGTANLAGAFIGADAAGDDVSGAISVRAATIADLNGMNRRLETSGFARERDYEVLQGNLDLDADSTITAGQVNLTADAGSVNVRGSIDASGTGDRGVIRLAARTDVVVADTASLAANGESATTRGGSIELNSTQGYVRVESGAQIAATSADGSGRLVLSAPKTADGTDAQIELAANIGAIDSVVLEPILQYSLAATPTAAQFTTIRNDVTSYMNVASANMLGRLSLTGASNVVVRPGLDLQASGNLTLGALDLTGGATVATTTPSGAWRFNGQAADITFRAGGSITINGVISDGFAVAASNNTTCASCIDLLNGPSSGLAFVAGADFSSARRGATVDSAAADLTLNAGAVVRTGAANILLAAARDINFNTGSVYTGGAAGAASTASTTTPRVRTTYPDADSFIDVVAGRDVLAAPVNRSIAAWQLRSGAANASWGINFNQFNWSVGALGGGDVSIDAGRDITNVSAAVADSARVDSSGNRNFFGGGNLQVTAGDDIGSLYSYVGHGTGRVTALGSIESARTDSGSALGSLLGAGDASYFVHARGDVLLEGMVESSLLTPTSGPTTQIPYFVRYAPDSTLDVSSASGNVEWFSGHLTAFTSNGNSGSAIDFQPANVNLTAYSGDVKFSGLPVYLYPSSQGELQIAAARDVLGGGRAVSMLDTAAAAIPTASHPATGTVTAASLLTNAGSQRLWSDALWHQQDTQPALISAGRDIVDGNFAMAKSATVMAGRDIVGLRYSGQNLNPDDVTLINAGRDISYPDNAGVSLAIGVAGPGQLTLLAGRDIDLGVSAGITTFGNLANGNLPDAGSDITLLAGLGGPLGIGSDGAQADFLTQIVEPSATYRDALIQYVQTVTGQPVADYAAAAAAFREFSTARQAPLAGRILGQELVQSGREVNADPTADYSRGYAAIDALFPGSRTSDSAYSGDLSLAFSRIYSLDGGAVELLVPGGRIDVGLANPPAALTATTGLNRKPSELGIVAQREGDVLMFAKDDILVNQSRVFTLFGGNIAIWSTQGNIDAGRGAKTSISAPPPVIVVDSAGNVSLDASASIAGSGIRTIRSEPEVSPGDVDLIAPAGFVNAGDAGIGSAGNLNIAAQQVLGLDNIQVGGVSTGVPPPVSGLGASLSGVTAAAGSSTNAATSGASDNQQSSQAAAPLAQTALSWLEVFVQGLGEENCNPNDAECLKRQKTR